MSTKMKKSAVKAAYAVKKLDRELMSAYQLRTVLFHIGACDEAIDWIGRAFRYDQPISAVWSELDNPEWACWLLQALGIHSNRLMIPMCQVLLDEMGGDLVQEYGINHPLRSGMGIDYYGGILHNLQKAYDSCSRKQRTTRDAWLCRCLSAIEIMVYILQEGSPFTTDHISRIINILGTAPAGSGGKSMKRLVQAITASIPIEELNEALFKEMREFR